MKIEADTDNLAWLNNWRPKAFSIEGQRRKCPGACRGHELIDAIIRQEFPGNVRSQGRSVTDIPVDGHNRLLHARSSDSSYPGASKSVHAWNSLVTSWGLVPARTLQRSLTREGYETDTLSC